MVSHVVADGGSTPDSREGPPGADRFPRPPLEFTDGADRQIRARVHGGGDPPLGMYLAFEDGDRAQGLPPRGEARIETWLEGLLEEGHHVVADHGGRTVGHATLVSMPGDRHELVIFVHPGYQLAGIGSRLIRALLGHGQREGVERVWLTVGSNNRVAKRLYRSVGFRVQSAGGEWEMERRL